MSAAPKPMPTCEGCLRTQEEAEGMLSVKKGGSRVHLCFGCIDGMAEIVAAIRAKGWPARPALKLVETAADA